MLWSSGCYLCSGVLMSSSILDLGEGQVIDVYQLCKSCEVVLDIIPVSAESTVVEESKSMNDHCACSFDGYIIGSCVRCVEVIFSAVGYMLDI